MIRSTDRSTSWPHESVGERAEGLDVLEAALAEV